jgi:hypothetical protein
LKKQTKAGARVALASRLELAGLTKDQLTSIKSWWGTLTNDDCESIESSIDRKKRGVTKVAPPKDARPPRPREPFSHPWPYMHVGGSAPQRDPDSDGQPFDHVAELEAGDDASDWDTLAAHVTELQPDKIDKLDDKKAIVAHVVGLPVQRVDDCGRARGTYLKKQQSARAKKLIKLHGIDEGQLRALAKGGDR